MTQEQIDKVYADLSEYYKEISEHNESILKLLGENAKRDFEELMDCCNVTEKINFVDGPKGTDNKEHCGVFRNVHVDQRAVGMEGDSWDGYIYAHVNGKWIEVPFSC